MNNNKYYTLSDFEKIKKIDVHTHISTSGTKFVAFAEAIKMKLFSINTDVPYAPYPSLKKQQEIVLSHKKRNTDIIDYATSFTVKDIEEKDWALTIIDQLKSDFKKGAIAVKVWKNIGMDDKYSNGNFIMIDDKALEPIINFLSDKKIPLLGHIGEPKNCWLPLEQMTVNNDREYFQKHPEYHMYKKSEFPSYEQILKARDNILEQNPELVFIGCHLGSQEWSIDIIGDRFDKSPNYAVDTAERVCHLQYQSQKDYEKVRDFFIKYQDRIIYGSDVEIFDIDNEDEIIEEMKSRWLSDWKYFATDMIMSAPEVNGDFKGLKLPATVVDKIYRLNYYRWIEKKVS